MTNDLIKQTNIEAQAQERAGNSDLAYALRSLVLGWRILRGDVNVKLRPNESIFIPTVARPEFRW